MSIAVSSQVVFGFEVDLKDILVKKTKYNEDTGLPYEIEVPDGNALYCQGKIIAIDEKYENDRFYAGELVENLELFNVGPYVGGDKKFCLGIPVVKSHYSEPCIKEFTPNVEEKKLVNIFADKHGLTPSFYLVQYIG